MSKFRATLQLFVLQASAQLALMLLGASLQEASVVTCFLVVFGVLASSRFRALCEQALKEVLGKP
jgi:hypothetical protein